jgi:elongation factor P--(R)-beta-lysine ligase
MSQEFLDSASLIRKQGSLLHRMRHWFHNQGYIEVYTPAIVPSPAMEEHLEAVTIGKHWLHTSPEFAMKKILASGICRIYQITPCYREEEIGCHHSLEFRMLEWYRVGASYWDIMDEVINLINTLCELTNHPIPKFERLPTDQFLPLSLPPEEWFYRWVDEIEPQLPEACIIYNYPSWQSALARKRGKYATRFEVYLKGVEIANAFDEENNSEEIRMRWKKNNYNRIEKNRKPYPFDEQFLSAIDKMPRCSGIALGIDRLFMILLEADCIQKIQTPYGST